MKKKILLIDDDRTYITLITAKLNAAGYEVAVASNGKEAFEKTKLVGPELIILDVLMPNMTGYEFVQKLRKQEDASKDIPVIVISGRQSMKEFFNSWEVHSFISKPFEPKELLAKVEAVLGPGDVPEPPDEDIPTVAVKEVFDPVAGLPVMVIAYEEFIRIKLKAYFEGLEFLVVTPADINEAVGSATKVAPCLIMTQFVEDPSKLDAEAIHQKMRALPNGRNIPFLVFCADGLAVDALKRFKVSQVIPYDKSDDLIKKIEKIMKTKMKTKNAA